MKAQSGGGNPINKKHPLCLEITFLFRYDRQPEVNHIEKEICCFLATFATGWRSDIFDVS